MGFNVSFQALAGLDAFCGERFWDNSIWRRSYPTLTRCFRHTALVWIPCLFIFFISPILTAQITYGGGMTLPWTRRLVVKLVLAVLLACDSLFLLIASFIQAATDRIPFAVDIVYPLMLFLAMILHIAFMFGFRRCGKLTSGGLFMSWLLFTICGLPEMIYWLHVSWNLEECHVSSLHHLSAHRLWVKLANMALTFSEESLRDDYCDLTFSQWFTHILWWPICLTELIFHCFADSPPLPWKAINEEKVSDWSRQLFERIDVDYRTSIDEDTDSTNPSTVSGNSSSPVSLTTFIE